MVPFSLIFVGEICVTIYTSKPSWMANMLSEDKGVCIVDAMKAYFKQEGLSHPKYSILNLDFIRNMAVG